MKQIKIFFFKWHFADQHAVVRELSDAAVRAYVGIINATGMGWPLPADHQRLAAVLGVPVEAVAEVLDRFGHLLTVERGELHHVDVLDAREKAEALSDKRAASGRQGASARWSDGNCQANAMANANGKCHSNCHGKPDGNSISDGTDTGVGGLKSQSAPIPHKNNCHADRSGGVE